MNLLEMMHMANRKNSQSGQDAFVLSYFQNKRNGIFVDIGANDGKTLSNTYYLEKNLGWTGFCFEPIPEIFARMNEVRDCIKINAAIAETKGTTKFTYVDGPLHMLSGITDKYDPRHVERIKKDMAVQGGTLREIEVQTVVFNDVMDEYLTSKGLRTIDYLTIDTEGNELGILKTIDFEKFDIKVMTIENNYYDAEQTNYIISKGYMLHGRLEADEVFTKVKH